MIENKFSEQELIQLLSPFIELKLPTQIIAAVEELLTTKLENHLTIYKNISLDSTRWLIKE